ncbi:MAG: (d)CMP kinase [Candidatus Dormibacteria bacterium]
MIVAIDGPSASGKTTIGRLVARSLDLPLVDTGLMYRAVTVLALEAAIPVWDAEGLAELARSSGIEVNTSSAEVLGWEVRAGGRDLGRRVFDAAQAPFLTQVSQVPQVRETLVEMQRAYGRAGVVMVGRDIGTVVFPHADLKLFVTASPGERLRRRARQMGGRGDDLLEGEVTGRDQADEGRSHSPLRAAEDAYTIDTDGRTVSEVFNEILKLIPGRSTQV